MGEIVINTVNLSKVYRLYHRSFDRVKEALSPFKTNYHKDFHALDNVTLSLKKGEVLGVIGKNGNGKSTLLKLIAGVLTPTKGTVKTKGRVSAILELTSNLKPEMTGLENIIYNLKIQGITKKQDIKEKTKEITEFAEVGEFIGQPIKTYSSGMKSRLGFGIATSVEPDILILDEVLAVGDFEFQQKCLSKINNMRDDTSIIFVSHSMNSVRLFCDRVIVLEKGSLTFNGKPDHAIKYYLEQVTKNKSKFKDKSEKLIKPFFGDLFCNKDKIYNINHAWDKEHYQHNDEMIFKFSFKLNFFPRNLIIGLPVWDKFGNMITSFNTDYKNIKFQIKGDAVEGRLMTSCRFNPGEFTSVIAIVDGGEHLYRELNATFEVTPEERLFGFVSFDHEWQINE